MQATSAAPQEPAKSQETESLVRRLAGPSSGKAGFVLQGLLRKFVLVMSRETDSTGLLKISPRLIELLQTFQKVQSSTKYASKCRASCPLF